MDIESVGEKLAWSLIEQKLVYDPSDIYQLTKEQLIALERMGDKSAQNVLDNITASKGRALTRVLFALGIRYVGYQTAELLAFQRWLLSRSKSPFLLSRISSSS